MHTAGPRLLLGPLLRFVDATRATVWVETDRPCEVEIRCAVPGVATSEPTWSVHGHHYALLQLTGLPCGADVPYEVLLDGDAVWPEPVSRFPPSLIRTFRGDQRFRLSFGSCRQSAPYDEEGLARYGADALVAAAQRMASTPTTQWMDALLLVGDQVYADDPSPHIVTRLRDVPAHHAHDGLSDEVRDFEGYTWLYHESWSEPAIRWLLSTVPTSMLLDDHDLRDDWNTSWAWREHMTSMPWWRDRVVGALGSYWVYQHLGNLSPEDLAADGMYRAVREAPDDEQRTTALDRFAWRADAEPGSARWSFSRELGDARLGIRLVAVDTRCSRRVDPQDRAMVDDAEWWWVTERALHREDDERVDHLIVASTLPVLLLHGIHHLEGWSEALVGGAWGRRWALFGEHLRQAVDLEHWAAFRASFGRLVELLRSVVTSARPPATVLLLSGDVHCSYTARARLAGTEHAGTAIHQLVMSPFRNPMELPLRSANWALEKAPVRGVWRALARLAGVRDVDVEWDVEHGPWFSNGLMSVVIDGRRAHVEVDHARVRGGRQQLARRLRSELTAPAGATKTTIRTRLGLRRRRRGGGRAGSD